MSFQYKLSVKLRDILRPVLEKSFLHPLSLYEGVLVKDKNDISFLTIGGDKGASKVLFKNKFIEPQIQNLLKCVVKKNDKILSLGAHIGAHVLLMCKLVGHNGHVFAFEANPNTLKFLRANVAFNDFKNVTIYPFAAFSQNTEITFVAHKTGNTSSSHINTPLHPARITSRNPLINSINVSAVVIDSIEEIQSIDILQMDIEGAEPDAILGATKLIDNSPNLLIIQEWSPEWIIDTASYLNFWRSRGYKIAKISSGDNIKDGLIELTDEQLIRDTTQIDIILTKDLIKIIKLCEEFYS